MSAFTIILAADRRGREPRLSFAPVWSGVVSSRSIGRCSTEAAPGIRSPHAELVCADRRFAYREMFARREELERARLRRVENIFPQG